MKMIGLKNPGGKKMSNNNDGGPAFPVIEPSDNQYSTPSRWGGMTLRDYFAAKAMQGIIFDISKNIPLGPGPDDDVKDEDIANLSYEIADAMLKERLK